MTYIIKRKLQGVLGDDVDNSEITSLIQIIQDNPVSQVTSQDTLIVNHLVVLRTMKIPVGTDKYK